MQVGTTKDQGLYNKPSAAVHPGALAAGTLPQYNIIQWENEGRAPRIIEVNITKGVSQEDCSTALTLRPN